MWVVFLVLLAAMVVLMILTSGAYKGNQTVTGLSMLATGGTCAVLAGNGYQNRRRGVEASTLQTVLMVVLGIMALLYLAVGVLGLVGVVQA